MMHVKQHEWLKVKEALKHREDNDIQAMLVYVNELERKWQKSNMRVRELEARLEDIEAI